MVERDQRSDRSKTDPHSPRDAALQAVTVPVRCPTCGQWDDVSVTELGRRHVCQACGAVHRALVEEEDAAGVPPSLRHAVVLCPECATEHGVAIWHLGREFECRKCRAYFRAKLPMDEQGQTDPAAFTLAEVVCPRCGKVYSVKRELLGRKLRCKKCQTKFRMRQGDQAAGGGEKAAEPRPGTRPRDTAESLQWLSGQGGVDPASVLRSLDDTGTGQEEDIDEKVTDGALRVAGIDDREPWERDDYPDPREESGEIVHLDFGGEASEPVAGADGADRTEPAAGPDASAGPRDQPTPRPADEHPHPPPPQRPRVTDGARRADQQQSRPWRPWGASEDQESTAPLPGARRAMGREATEATPPEPPAESPAQQPPATHPPHHDRAAHDAAEEPAKPPTTRRPEGPAGVVEERLAHLEREADRLTILSDDLLDAVREVKSTQRELDERRELIEMERRRLARWSDDLADDARKLAERAARMEEGGGPIGDRARALSQRLATIRDRDRAEDAGGRAEAEQER